MNPGRERALVRLRSYFEAEARLRQERDLEMRRYGMPRDQLEERLQLIERQLMEREEQTVSAFESILDFPPDHVEHLERLRDFHKDGHDFEKSVFIITKYPKANPADYDDKDRELICVIDAVKDAVSAANGDFTPRLASDRKYHDQLWPNVELYLMGCKRAVAIVEDEYYDELNPNVALEWGWMRALKRDVMYLLKSGFKQGRADTEGFLRTEFDWHDPEAMIRPAIIDWLSG